MVQIEVGVQKVQSTAPYGFPLAIFEPHQADGTVAAAPWRTLPRYAPPNAFTCVPAQIGISSGGLWQREMRSLLTCRDPRYIPIHRHTGVRIRHITICTPMSVHPRSLVIVGTFSARISRLQKARVLATSLPPCLRLAAPCTRASLPLTRASRFHLVLSARQVLSREISIHKICCCHCYFDTVHLDEINDVMLVGMCLCDQY